MPNSLRDEIKDAIRYALDEAQDKNFDADIIANIADAVFEILGISPKDQDKPFKRGQ